MQRFVRMLSEGMQARGHTTEIWSPEAYFYRFKAPKAIRKWLGYLDQFLLFPLEVQHRIKACSADTLFVFTDQALGPWVPMLAHKPHVLHCHDFLALKSALGEIKENPTSWTGRLYQKLIRWGFSKGNYFIAVSDSTRNELRRFLCKSTFNAVTVYNQVATAFKPRNVFEARLRLCEVVNSTAFAQGFLLHVGANVWYKNKDGVLELYLAWRQRSLCELPLLMIGEPPTESMLKRLKSSEWGRDVVFLSAVSESLLADAYAGATLFLFPSLEEGFGWPIAEALASGCLVLTTQKAPMTEVGGAAAFYISRMPAERTQQKVWAEQGSIMIERIMGMSAKQREAVITEGLEHVKKFEAQAILNQMEEQYRKVLLKSYLQPKANLQLS